MNLTFFVILSLTLVMLSLSHSIMAYYSYKRARDQLIEAGWLVFSADLVLTPADIKKYGNEVDNTYNGNLYDMLADYIDQLKST